MYTIPWRCVEDVEVIGIVQVFTPGKNDPGTYCVKGNFAFSVKTNFTFLLGPKFIDRITVVMAHYS